IDRREIFSRTGIQFLPINTLFQLFAHKLERLEADRVTLLLIPDLMNFFLTGRMSVEYTNATTTQLVNAASRSWDREIIDAVGLPQSIFPSIVSAGTRLGGVRPGLAGRLGRRGAGGRGAGRPGP